jgi:hypothetical protein
MVEDCRSLEVILMPADELHIMGLRPVRRMRWATPGRSFYGCMRTPARMPAATEDKEKEYVRRERRYRSFSRSMPLPDGVEAKKIKARSTMACSR